MDPFSFFAPTRLFSGRGALAKIPGILTEWGRKKPLVVTDPGLVKAGLAGRLVSLLDAEGVACAVYDGVEANPAVRVVHVCAERYAAEECDCLIAIGGGSAMDTAKAAGVVLANGGRIEDYFWPRKVKERGPFLLCVPTTYGTGSEVTPFAVITDKNRYKAALIGPEILPDVGLLDSDMAVTLPLPIAAATGMDALTHAVESYVALATNPISQGLALHAISLISEHLRPAASSDANHEATQQMLIASTMAGLAFSQTRLGNVHAMSHPVSGHFGVPHGVANAILLPRVMAFNLIALPEAFAEIAAAMGQDVEGRAPMEAASCAVEAVSALERDIEIPETLTEAGVTAEDIPVLAEDAMKSGNIPINPRRTVQSDIEGLFEQAL
jgi:alcohol dehydrogenase class IV